MTHLRRLAMLVMTVTLIAISAPSLWGQESIRHSFQALAARVVAEFRAPATNQKAALRCPPARHVSRRGCRDDRHAQVRNEAEGRRRLASGGVRVRLSRGTVELRQGIP